MNDEPHEFKATLRVFPHENEDWKQSKIIAKALNRSMTGHIKYLVFNYTKQNKDNILQKNVTKEHRLDLINSTMKDVRLQSEILSQGQKLDIINEWKLQLEQFQEKLYTIKKSYDSCVV